MEHYEIDLLNKEDREKASVLMLEEIVEFGVDECITSIAGELYEYTLTSLEIIEHVEAKLAEKKKVIIDSNEAILKLRKASKNMIDTLEELPCN